MQGVDFTFHSDGHGTYILRRRFDLIKKFILTILEEEGPCSSEYLQYRISDKLTGLFDGQLTEYIEYVKSGLEKERIIERLPKARFRQLRIKK